MDLLPAFTSVTLFLGGALLPTVVADVAKRRADGLTCCNAVLVAATVAFRVLVGVTL